MITKFPNTIIILVGKILYRYLFFSYSFLRGQLSLSRKAYYQAFFRVLIDLIVELLGLIIKPFDNQTES
jgi:hypothetical protein